MKVTYSCVVRRMVSIVSHYFYDVVRVVLILNCSHVRDGPDFKSSDFDGTLNE